MKKKHLAAGLCIKYSMSKYTYSWLRLKYKYLGCKYTYKYKYTKYKSVVCVKLGYNRSD